MEKTISTKEFTTESVISKDGTKIGYRKLGNGPGVILVHGGMMSSENFRKLGDILSDDFTVYIPDRRGRGKSGFAGNPYKPSLETEDLQAIIHKTKAQNIFGLSSGAIHSLQTALAEPMLKKVALYEPPILINGITPTIWFNSYERAISKGNFGKAFTNIIKGTADFSLFSLIPGFILSSLMNLAIKAQEKNAKEEEVTLKALLLTMRYDIKTVIESEGVIAKCKNLEADVLLLGGNRSRKYLKIALDELSKILPKYKRIEFSGVGHLAADNSGKPELVAKELRLFFA
jgi:pimeloyl-ACP methyl ester carboxylesterase